MFNLIENVNFEGYTLLIACVSVGNTAQMVADLFISSLKMKKIANCWHPACVPIVGANPFGHDINSSSKNSLNSLSTALEMFHEPSKKVAIIQMRSCTARSLKAEFLNELVRFIENKKMSKVIILTSCYSHRLAHLCDSVYYGTLSLHYIGSTNLIAQYDTILKSKNWTLYNTEDDNGCLINSIPGYAKILYEKCIAHNLPALLAFKYCTEGDNREDAINTTQMLNGWINVLNKTDDEVQLVIPKSWSFFYGNTAPVNIF